MQLLRGPFLLALVRLVVGSLIMTEFSELSYLEDMVADSESVISSRPPVVYNMPALLNLGDLMFRLTNDANYGTLSAEEFHQLMSVRFQSLGAANFEILVKEAAVAACRVQLGEIEFMVSHYPMNSALFGATVHLS